MKVFNHVFNTWVLAQLLHPIIFFTYFSFVLNESLEPGALVSLLVCAFIISAPSLFISFLLLRFIVGKKIAVTLSLFIWIVIAAASILLNITLFLLLLKSSITDIPLEYILPAFIAALLSILIRLPLFMKLIDGLKCNTSRSETSSYETKL